MNDRELLELAAKAAGRIVGDAVDPIDRKYCESLGLWCAGPYEGWFNPMNSEGEALSLSVRLKMDIYHYPRDNEPHVSVHDEYNRFGGAIEDYDGNALAATCRAITRTAAEIGKSL